MNSKDLYLTSAQEKGGGRGLHNNWWNTLQIKASLLNLFGCRQSAECLVITGLRVTPQVKATLHELDLPSGDRRSEAGIFL